MPLFLSFLVFKFVILSHIFIFAIFLAARTKSITDALYPCSKEDGKDVDVTEDDKLKNKKGKKKWHKSTAPNSISKPGTYYRIINTYMADQNCPDVVNIGSNPTMADLDSRRFVHQHFQSIIPLEK